MSARSIARYVQAGQITPALTTPGRHYRWDLDQVREQIRELAQRDKKD